MRYKIITFLILLLMFIPLSLADSPIVTDYSSAGTPNTDYQLGEGRFNLQITTDTITSKGLNNPVGVPLADDFDGDGNIEIAVVDGSVIKVYFPLNLSVKQSFTFPVSSGDFEYSQLYAFDIDGDTEKEFIIVEEQEELLYIINYNSSEMNLQLGMNLSNLSMVNSETMLACRAANQCILAYGTSDDHTEFDEDFFVTGFNSTTIGNETEILSLASGDSGFCPPQVEHIAVNNYDRDAETEFILSTVHVVEVGADIVYLLWIAMSSDLTPSLEQSVAETIGVTLIAGCDTQQSAIFFTPPLVANLDGGNTDAETVIAFMADPDEFIMKIYDSTATEIDRSPDSFEADGTIISNVFLGTFFSDSDQDTDVCVAGFEQDDREFDILCHSETTAGQDDEEYVFSLTDNSVEFNITINQDKPDIISHSVEMSQSIIDGFNPDEVLSSYGVLLLDRDDTFGFQIPPRYTAKQIYSNNDIESATYISVDAEQIGLQDLIAIGVSNIHYIDDGFANTRADIDLAESSTNPCLDSTWKLNTTINIILVVDDIDNDDVSGRITAYSGTTNEFVVSSDNADGFSNNVSASQNIFFSFIANKTISSGDLRLEGRDVGNQGIDTETISYSVSSTGLESGDCSGPLGEEIVGAGDPCVTSADCSGNLVCNPSNVCEVLDSSTLTEDETDNAITEGLVTLGGLLGLAGTTVWLIFMISISIGMWFEMAKREFSGNSTLGAIFFVNFLMIVLASRLGIFTTGLVVIITVVSIVILGVFLAKFLTGLSGESA